MTIQRMTELGGLSRSRFYRFDPEEKSVRRDTALRDEIQRIPA
jgi:hypothetical protein